MENEFTRYSLPELEAKKVKFRKRQIFIMAVCGVAILILTIFAIIKKSTETFQLIPFFIISGVGMPYIIFNPIRKKIQKEIKARSEQS